MRTMMLCLAATIFTPAIRLSAADNISSLPMGTLSPGIQEAITEISADDFQTRDKAFRSIEQQYDSQMKEVFAPISSTTLVEREELAAFQQGFARWILHVLSTTPESDRTKLINFGFRPESRAIVSRIYSSDIARRMEGIRALKNVQGAEADLVLASLIADVNRPIYVTAMDIAWERPASAVLLNPLWYRAVGDLDVWTGRGMIGRPTILNFRGQPLDSYYDGEIYKRIADGDLATQVLKHWNSPLVENKVVEMFEALHAGASKLEAGQRNPYILFPGNKGAKALVELASAYKPKAILTDLWAIANDEVRERFDPSTGGSNEKSSIVTNRTDALALLVLVTGQKLEDYDIAVTAHPWGNYASESEAGEENAVNRLKVWWKANKEKYLTAAITTSDSKTRPQ